MFFVFCAGFCNLKILKSKNERRVTNNFQRKILLMNNNFNIQKGKRIPKPETLNQGTFYCWDIPKLLCKYEIDWRKLKSPFFEVLNLKPVNLD